MLETFGRSGVPLYLLYSPGKGPSGGAPAVLPQVLSEQIVLEALGAGGQAGAPSGPTRKET
jgi:thiol:disulfide interchange protein DsbD